MKKEHTEEDIRNAFKAGHERGVFDGANNYFDAPLDEDEYIQSIKKPIESEETVPYTYAHLISVLGWEGFCDVTGISYYAKNEGAVFNDNEIFYISKSDVTEYLL